MEDTTLQINRRRQELNELKNEARAQTPRPLEENRNPYENSENISMQKGGESNIMQKIALPIIGVLFVAISAYFAFMFISLKGKQIENEAKYQCAQSSRYQVAKGDNVIWYPAEELYKKCLEEKGIK